MKNIDINNSLIGVDQPPYIIAEVGINHEGDYQKAIELIEAAISAGADCVKFQCHITDKEMIPTDIRPGDISDEPVWDITKRCELTESEERELMEICESRGMTFLSSPFSREAADRLESMNVPAYKIGSGECNNIPLIRHIASFGKPILLSTGMNNLSSISESVRVIESFGVPLILLHCTSMYPTPYKNVRLGGIKELSEKFKVPVGISDHSLGIYTSLGAVALGACVIEKHFTVSRDWPGPDIPISIEPEELSELVIGSRAIYNARGGSKGILIGEQPIIDFAYSSVVSIRKIDAGEVFSEDNLWVKRPGTGEILAAEFDQILGKRAIRVIPTDTQIKRVDVG